MVEATLNSQITTWDELPPLEGNVLLVVNSEPGDTQAVALALCALEGHADPDALHVLAGPSWSSWLDARGLSDTRVRLTTDDNGQSVELNHFLESPPAALWIVPRQFRVIVGSSPHNLYNEEVKEIFEQRVCLLIGDGRFIAHALPHRYLAVLDLAALVRRLGRRERTRGYQEKCRSFVQDCHDMWRRQGSPARSDGGPTLDLLELVGRHFGHENLRFDEDSPALCPASEPKDLEALGLYCRKVLCRQAETLTAMSRDRVDAAQAILSRDAMLVEMQAERKQAVALRDGMLAELQAERNRAVALRDAMLVDLQAERDHAVAIRDGMLADLQAERGDAVRVRDEIIANLQREVDFLTRGWRRWVVTRRG